jgi:hypothetical protein
MGAQVGLERANLAATAACMHALDDFAQTRHDRSNED